MFAKCTKCRENSKYTKGALVRWDQNAEYWNLTLHIIMKIQIILWNMVVAAICCEDALRLHRQNCQLMSWWMKENTEILERQLVQNSTKKLFGYNYCVFLFWESLVICIEENSGSVIKCFSLKKKYSRSSNTWKSNHFHSALNILFPKKPVNVKYSSFIHRIKVLYYVYWRILLLEFIFPQHYEGTHNHSYADNDQKTVH